jgi:RND family efflux transporter MFP subunit
MKSVAVFLVGVGTLALLCVAWTGCSRPGADLPAQATPTVLVSYPVERTVTDYADFTARAAAVDSVEVRARVWGYLDKVYFKEGELVNKGDVLFEIDPAIYRAEYEAAGAKLSQSQAALQLAVANNKRYMDLFKENPAAVSKLDLDKYAAEETQAVANLAVAKANVQSAKLNLDWTKIVAPVSGRISRYYVTKGNLVQSGETGGTMLTTIVSVDPIYAYFDVDEHTVLRVRQLIREGKMKSARETPIKVWLGLAIEEGYPHEGTINFVDNQVNPKTGTLRARGVFPNKNEALSPGFFARVRVPIGPPHPALLVTDRALDNDQGQKILYVVNDKNEVTSRPVRLGALHDGLRAVEDGVRPGERIIVNGIQQVRPGTSVGTKLVPMPTPGGRKVAAGGQMSEVRDQKQGAGT